MEERIRDMMITKCRQLAEGMSARVVNIVAWMTQNVEGRLMPLLRGEADVRRIPYCGAKTAIYIEAILQELRDFYQQLQEQTADAAAEASGQESFLFVTPTDIHFSFLPQDEPTEQRIQTAFEQMLEEVPDMRVRNLIRTHLKSYREAEQYINHPSLIWKWYGAGQIVVEHIRLFLDKFREEYLSRANSLPDTDAVSIRSDYTFLSDEEQAFVTSFYKAHGRYPVWFIALCYYRRASERPSQAFARVNGLWGRYDSIQTLAEEYGLTLERVRQLSRFTFRDKKDIPPVWSRERWATASCYQQPVLTEENTHWAELCQLEQLGDLDFYAGLAILSKVRPIGVVALMADGTSANGRRAKDDPWQQPEVLFGFDLRLNSFHFAACLKELGHEATLQRINDKTQPLEAVARDFFQPETDEETRAEVLRILKEVLPMLAHVRVEGDDVILQTNRINYGQEIYQILQQHGEAMTVDDIYTEFRHLHPDDHHTDSTFIRSYMLQDERFEAVGRKSTYQLKEWQRFSGALGDLAVKLLIDSEVPLTQEELCQKMLAARSNTTHKSCVSSIYLAVMDGRLQYLMTEENPSTTAYVGLSARDYPERFWCSTLTVDGVVSSMHRFITENGRWPYITNRKGIEGVLSYNLRKYTSKLHVTEDEYTRYHQGMADIPSYLYPKNERDATFITRCNTLRDFQQQNHRLPKNEEEPQLMEWYRKTQNKQHELDELRNYYFGQITKLMTTQPGEQLSIIFDEYI